VRLYPHNNWFFIYTISTKTPGQTIAFVLNEISKKIAGCIIPIISVWKK
jgi:hypothetical protein